MTKTIIGVGVAIFVLGGLIWIAQPNSGKNTAALSQDAGGNLIVEDAHDYDFGSISMAAGKVNHQFKIKNSGSSEVNIEKMYTSCMCTTASLLKGDVRFGPYGMPGHSAIPRIDQAIGPGEEATVEIVFDPAAHGPAGVGKIQRTITVENDAGRPVELQFSAVVTP